MTIRGIHLVEHHLSGLDPSKANDVMLRRLRAIAAGTLGPHPIDLNFYAHELRERVRYRRMGYTSVELKATGDVDHAREVWNSAHTATLEEYGIANVDLELYHEDARPFLDR